LPYISSIY